MLPKIEHFTDYTPERVKICNGIANGLEVKGRGTLAITFQDSNGAENNICVPNAAHVKDLPNVLISPQHWGQHTSNQV